MSSSKCKFIIFLTFFFSIAFNFRSSFSFLSRSFSFFSCLDCFSSVSCVVIPLSPSFVIPIALIESSLHVLLLIFLLSVLSPLLFVLICCFSFLSTLNSTVTHDGVPLSFSGDGDDNGDCFS